MKKNPYFVLFLAIILSLFFVLACKIKGPFLFFTISAKAEKIETVPNILTSVYPPIGFASWYSAIFTASGERFCEHSFTCAMHRKDFGKYYSVCNLENGKCVLVRQNDFGPSEEFYKQGRIIDLTRRAFSQISDTQEGVIKVAIKEVLDPSTK